MTTDLTALAQDALHAQIDERGIVGCLLNANELVRAEALNSVDIGAFTDDFSILVVATIKELHEQAKPVDCVSVTKEICKGAFDGGIANRLSETAGEHPSSSNWPYHLQGVEEAYRRRKIALAADNLARAARDAGADTSEALSALEEAKTDNRRTTGQDSKSLTRELIDDIQARRERQGQLTGISFGFPILDSMTDGIQQGEYIILGARPSIGKTAMAVTMLSSIAVQAGISCSFLSLETKPIGIHRRLMANVSGVSLSAIRSGQIDQYYQRITVAAAKISKSPIQYHYGLGTMDGRKAAQIIRNDARKHGIRIAFIDYLQHLKIDGNAEKRTYGIAENSAEVKRACDETGVAVIALAQLSRLAEDDERMPKLSDIAECGQIERDADTVLLLHRKRDETIGDGSLLVAKARDGECGLVPISYHGPTIRFTQRSPIESAQ